MLGWGGEGQLYGDSALCGACACACVCLCVSVGGGRGGDEPRARRLAQRGGWEVTAGPTWGPSVGPVGILGPL